MTTVHPHAPHHPARLPVLAAILVAVGVLAVVLLTLQSDAIVEAPGRTADRSATTTEHSGESTIVDAWDTLCFKPDFRDAGPCQQRSAPATDSLTGGRLP